MSLNAHGISSVVPAFNIIPVLCITGVAMSFLVLLILGTDNVNFSPSQIVMLKIVTLYWLSLQAYHFSQ